MKVAISKLFGSVMARLTLIFGALALMTGAAVAVGWLVFLDIAAGMATFSDESLPKLRTSAEIVAATDQTRNALEEILVISEQGQMAPITSQTAVVLQRLQASVQDVPAAERAELLNLISEVSTALDTLIAARNKEFEGAASVAQAMHDVVTLSNLATGLLQQESDKAYADLVAGGDATIAGISTTLTRLIEDDFTLHQTALGIKSEVNLLSGVALSRSQTRDPAMKSILDDLANSAASRLAEMVEALAKNPATEDLAASVEAASTDLLATGGRLSPSAILSLRQQIDADLSSALDDLYFELVINSDDAMTKNEAAVRKLLDGQVAHIRATASLSLATREFVETVMQVALARGATDLAEKTGAMGLSAQELVKELQGQAPEVVAKLSDLVAIADPDAGISATRAAAFAAKNSATEAAHAAAEAVREIATEAGTFALIAQSQIDTTAETLNNQVLTARDWMQQIAVISALLVAAAPILIWLMITRPLNRVTDTTERLAEGDLSEIVGLGQSHGEIGRMAAALHVFREGSLERIRLQEEEKRREADAYEAKRQRERDQQLAAKEARLEKERAAERERQRQAEEAAREEQARLKAEAERRARAQEQALVVDALAQSLQRLSAGDLTHTIEAEFPGGYEALRQDYNAAIGNLSALIRKIGESSGTIENNAAEISTSSINLAKRTENSAATLEQTAAALNQMTVSVASSASGASDAAKAVGTVKADAEASHLVMHEAVGAMGEIEQSSTKISKIVEVIDAIAFQTSLLALNAGVEAARAGEAGRGFAVVASEVRVLAQRCSEAALEINALITGATDHVGKGVSLIDKTSAALKTILKGIGDVSQHVSHIASSASEQSVGIAEINNAVTDLDRSTQQNAAMFEETTAANQALTNEAQNLAQIVAGFVICKQDSFDVEVPEEASDAA